MSDDTVVETDGIRVSKSFDADGFPVPAVRFDVTSTRDDETRVTISDEIPDEFDIDQIGFHPEYGSEHWTATGEGVVRFERKVEAFEEFTTVYGVRMSEDQESSAFLDAPTVTVGGEASDTNIEDVVPPDSSNIVRELAGGKRDTLPGLEAEDSLPVDAETDAADTNEPLLDALHQDEGDVVDAEHIEPAVTAVNDDGTETEPEPVTPDPSIAEIAESTAEDAGAAPTSTDESDAPTTTEAPSGTEREPTPVSSPIPESDAAVDSTTSNIVRELADQIRNDEIRDEDRAVLRQEFAPKRSNVQIEHLQSRVSEMEAYADALGAFIDENGDARGVLEALQSDVAAMESDVSDLQSSVESASADRQRIRDALDDVEATLESLEDVDDRIDRVAGDVEALDERVGGVEESVSDVDALSDDIDALRAEMRELKEWRDQLSDVFSGA